MNMRKKTDELSRREEYTEATRQALLLNGRRLFAQEGFQATGIEAISLAARVTRGAFYHHFEDKRALFDAVVVSLQIEAAAKIEERTRGEPDLWERLDIGINTYLDICLEPIYRRIVIQEAPVVLGEARYREINEVYPMALLTATLGALRKRGELEFGDVELLSRVVDAMICKVAVLLPETNDPDHVRKEGKGIIDSLLKGFRRV